LNKEILKRHKKNKMELELINDQLAGLNERLDNVEIISGKVTKSSDDFPYIEEHMTVQMAEPKAATELKRKIRKKEKRREILLSEIEEVDDFIAGMPEGIDKQIFEMVYLEGMPQREAGRRTGYTQGRVAQIINNFLKD